MLLGVNVRWSIVLLKELVIVIVHKFNDVKNGVTSVTVVNICFALFILFSDNHMYNEVYNFMYVYIMQVLCCIVIFYSLFKISNVFVCHR